MPIYAYSCEKCGSEFERLITRTDRETPVSCPQCASQSVARTIALPAKTSSLTSEAATNCRGDGPPCSTFGCGRMRQ